MTTLSSFILTKDPKKVIRKNRRLTHQSLSPLEQTIAEAMKRRSLKLKNEEDLCLYLPYNDSRMRSTRFQSMKNENPEQLRELIEQYVLKPKKPRIQERKRKANDLNNKQQSEVENIEPQKISQFDQLLEAIQESTQSTKQLLESLQNSQPIRSTISPSGDEHFAPFNKPLTESRLESKFERYFRSVQNQLISQIRQRRVDHELWNKFSELVENVLDSF